jgi:hypothetical protein
MCRERVKELPGKIFLTLNHLSLDGLDDSDLSEQSEIHISDTYYSIQILR